MIRLKSTNTFVLLTRFLNKSNLYRFSNSHQNKSPSQHNQTIKQHNEVQTTLYQQSLTDQKRNFAATLKKNYNSKTLYAVLNKLPLSILTKYGKYFIQNPSVTINSDNLQLPKITPNGVPIYDNLFSGVPMLTRLVENFLFVGLATGLYIQNSLMIAGIFGYLIYSIGVGRLRLTVLKMQYDKSTQQIVYQTVGLMAQLQTHRTRMSDLQHVQFDKLNELFKRSTPSYINQNIVFRRKSTKEYLLFANQSIWHQEGLKFLDRTE